ncbi:UNVERIFIED_CONTAM: hypothetical protein HDU68_006737 [Siphonaria sp. JEL0065]|nr:hypothetical protein HDU68_006737 [Siphonaria sp. JEL0065]
MERALFLAISKTRASFFENQSQPVVMPAKEPPSPASTIMPDRKWFDTVMIINLENTDYPDAISTAPFNTLNFAPHNATLLTNFRALAHPSQPNYIAQVVGETVVNSDDITTLAATCVVDLLEKKGVSWASYAEGYPDDWNQEKPYLKEHDATGRYVRRHVPLISIASIQDNPERASKIKSGEAFKRDLEAGILPQYIYYTPDQFNNGHDTNIRYAGHYISEFLLPLLSHPHFTSRRSLFIVTFDEAAFWMGKNIVATWLLGNAVKSNPLPEPDLDSTPPPSTTLAPSNSKSSSKATSVRLPPTDTSATAQDSAGAQLASLFLSAFTKPMVERGFTDKTKFDHYSILKTVEENWGLGDLGRKDRKAVGFGDLLHSV